MLARGREQLEIGNIVAARQYFRRAADAGLADGALQMGDTYDAAELGRRGVVGVRGDPAEARRWFEKARDLGAVAEATQRLERIAAGK